MLVGPLERRAASGLLATSNVCSRCYSRIPAKRDIRKLSAFRPVNPVPQNGCRPRFASSTTAGSTAATETFATSSMEQWAADAALEEAAAAAALEEGTAEFATESLSDLGLGGFSPVGLIESMLDGIHSTLGLPWWMSIVLGTVCFRTALLPLTFYGRKKATKLREIDPEAEELRELRTLYHRAKSRFRADQTAQRLHAVHQKAGARTTGAMVPYIGQFTVLYCGYRAIRNLAFAPVVSMMTEGALWFPDLTSPDMVLAIVNGAAMMAMFRLGDGGVAAPNLVRLKWFITVSTALSVPIFVNLPSGFLVFSISSASFSIGHALLMKYLDHVRGYPALPIDAKDPIYLLKKFFEDQKVNSVIRNKSQALNQAHKLYKKQLKDKNPKIYKRNPLYS